MSVRNPIAAHARGGGPSGREPTAKDKDFIDRWKKILFETWEPHRNRDDGGALLMKLKSPTDCSITWCPHRKLVDLMTRGNCLHPPCDRPAHEVTPPVSGVPGDICWVLVFDRETVHVHAVEWPITVAEEDVADVIASMSRRT